jgi:DNA polymerase elongation subunit (family B)
MEREWSRNRLGRPRWCWCCLGFHCKYPSDSHEGLQLCLLIGFNTAFFPQSGRVVFAGWKILADEVKHPNASYLPAVVSSVLDKRIPFHDNLKLSQWYGHDRGKERWRVLHHKLVQATSCLLLFDALDIIGRSGEAARLSGVEFSQSFPGIRGSQYKVEGVLLRALQSLNSHERGSKKGSKVKLSNVFASSSLSDESKSQTQSPWKARRRTAAVPDLDPGTNGGEERPRHQLKSRSYLFYSPSLQDTNKQEALEVQALTLEPQSGHHKDPVVVCDFTALYPSLVIAYNLC